MLSWITSPRRSRASSWCSAAATVWCNERTNGMQRLRQQPGKQRSRRWKRHWLKRVLRSPANPQPTLPAERPLVRPPGTPPLCSLSLIGLFHTECSCDRFNNSSFETTRPLSINGFRQGVGVSGCCLAAVAATMRHAPRRFLRIRSERATGTEQAALTQKAKITLSMQLHRVRLSGTASTIAARPKISPRLASQIDVRWIQAAPQLFLTYIM